MTASLVLNDVLIWSLQIGFLVALAAILPPVLGLKIPKTKLAFRQVVLVTCLALPFVSSWKPEVIAGTVTVSTALVSIASGPAVRHFSPISMPLFVLLLAGVGTLVRFGLLLAGFRRLRRYRLRSRPLEPASAWGVEAELCISEELASPVTFGFRKPVVLLPAGFPAFGEGVRDAILCHEILHVRRHDWLVTVGEEFVRALFWFHPAIWWLLREIQLVREQTVDREVVEMTLSRDQYIDALLVIAGAPPRINLASAPLFLRKRHLKQRVVSILKEVQMSKAKSISALAASLTLLTASCWVVTGVLPLRAAPQVVADAPGVGVASTFDTGLLLHRAGVSYPDEAIAKGVQGTVVVQVRTDAEGKVSDATVISGPDELRRAVLRSVLDWHFAKTAALSTQQFSISFALPKAAGAMAQIDVRPRPASVQQTQTETVIKSIVITGLSNAATLQLRSQLPVREGDSVSGAMMIDLRRTVHEFDEHLSVLLGKDDTLYIAVPVGVGAFNMPPPPPPPPAGAPPDVPGAIRVGGDVQRANLVSQNPKPVYPPLAKAARVQGVVSFQATISKEGTVQNLQLLSGPPLLVQAALQAVQQWVYKPTLMNGNPVAVITTIDVNFTLAE